MEIHKESIEKIFRKLQEAGVVDKIGKNKYIWIFSDDTIKNWLEHGTVDTETATEIEKELKNIKDICILAVFDLENQTSKWTYSKYDNLKIALRRLM